MSVALLILFMSGIEYQSDKQNDGREEVDRINRISKIKNRKQVRAA